MSSRRVFGNFNGTGPVHLCQAPPHTRLAWCGARQQFRHREFEGGVHDVTCPRCITAIRREQPKAWGSR